MSTKKYSIRKAAVLGSGVMGRQIAAHCINAGLEVILLDLKSDDPDRPNKMVEEGLKKAKDMKPAPFGKPGFMDRIEVGNFEDDFDKLKDADWICEVIIEKMDIKKDLMSRIDDIRKPETIVSSNTSGLPISEIGEECSEELKAHFLGTHFFNPPRYMKLLEVIPTESTSVEVTEFMHRFCEKTLGKGVVICKDTPNFIANRVGIFSIANIMPYFFNGDFRAEEIDLLTGTLTGYSKAATFRTADMAGLDVTNHVAKNLYPSIPDDEMQETFNLPHEFQEMVDEGMIGNKAGKGFYTKKDGEYLVLNSETFEYESQQALEDPILKDANAIKDKAERLKFLVNSDGKIGDFLWNIHRDLLMYAANRIPEITDSPLSIDRAMQWGFNWEMGPFERWDALGIKETADRIGKEGKEVPKLISDMMDAGFERFYNNGKVYDPEAKSMKAIPPEAKGEVKVEHLRKEKSPVMENNSVALHDMGDGVALFEFHTPHSTLGAELVQSLFESLDIVKKDFDALVISHDNDNFAFGANLKEALTAKQNGDWETVVEAVNNFQRTAVALRYAPFPVVAAPFGKTLGGGVEFCLYSDKVVAHHELYMGLVEVGVGLIPAGGGTTELLRRAMNKLEGEADPLPFIREVFKTIGMAKVSESAHLAKELGYLRESDTIVMNRDLLIKTAKEEALNLVQAGYRSPAETPIKVLGKTALAAMKLMLHVMHEGKYITDYDQVVAERVAYVLAGGDLSEAQEVPESYLLRLEREAILECLQDDRTLDRMEHMLKKGKPLRN
ncbi:MAG: 3-hydroxyacyl-CoA dehydrogenase/enoyl-CoA hydratase family protein [Gracilimonas sp.]|uniref:3-hydroxyacyl-CoA dehydrogenase/enoyl-CoA hydratase family protein n=1 Tax=Gracilimonas sp. TaxID=1974203 RepID=UPI0037501770|nr:3-hydroxyacyl-CoA dehydrogenase/enoyl-CoA hydratase family protein [Gracilimonas sp.]